MTETMAAAEVEVQEDDLPEYEVTVVIVERHVVTAPDPQIAVQRVLNSDRAPDTCDLTITVTEVS